MNTRSAYKAYVLATLTGLTTLNYLDRVLIGLFLQPIKEDLTLTDTQLGFLSGIAFALFYATLGIPISRWADRRNRVSLASLAIGLWGLTVMSCVFVGNFTQLVVARVAAAVGEAGCIPPTYSLVGDYFPKSGERARALAIYMASNPLAVLIGYIIGGLLNDRFGWRLSFFVVGAPGLLLAILVKSSIAEPRLHFLQVNRVLPPSPRLRDVSNWLWRQRTVRHLILGLILFMTMGWGLTPWYAAFLIRSHGMSPSEVGIAFGLIVGCAGLVGMLVGGYVADRWLCNQDQKQMRMTAVLLVGVIPFFGLFLLLPERSAALTALAPMVLAFNCFSGPIYALLQRLVPDEIRATVLAIVLLLGNLIGMGMGPQIVGILSDELAPSFGPDSLRYAMLSMAFVALCSAYHFWRAGETVEDELPNSLPRRVLPESSKVTTKDAGYVTNRDVSAGELCSRGPWVADCKEERQTWSK